MINSLPGHPTVEKFQVPARRGLPLPQTSPPSRPLECSSRNQVVVSSNPAILRTFLSFSLLSSAFSNRSFKEVLHMTLEAPLEFLLHEKSECSAPLT